jgi:hypothetical protein
LEGHLARAIAGQAVGAALVNLKRPRGNVITRAVRFRIDPSTDTGRADAFAHGASECLRDAKKLHEIYLGGIGAFILTAHALELALKAFLARLGLSNGELARKPFGHDLVRLCAEARKRGLTLSTHQADALIQWINEYHDKGALLRYDFTETRELPNCDTLFPIVDEILKAIRT